MPFMSEKILLWPNSAGRTRTCDLRVMSPASFQLLYLALFLLLSDRRCLIVKEVFP